MNFKYIAKNIKYFLNTSTFKIIYIITILIGMSLLISYKYSNPSASYFELFLSLLSTNSFVIFSYFLTSLIAGINTYLTFEKKRSYIIRLENKKEYLIHLLKNIWSVNTVLFIITTLTSLIMLNLINNNFIIEKFQYYSISNLTYIIYTLIRIFLLSQLLTTISILLFKLINHKIIIFMNLIIYGITMLTQVIEIPKSSILDMSFWVGYYISPDLYSSFMLEVSSTFLFLIIMLVLIIIIFDIDIKFMKQIGD